MSGLLHGAQMNYRHAFHAGNFADLLKHAMLLAALDAWRAGGGTLEVLDTHAGAGLYDLGAAEAVRSGEAQAGVTRLMAADGLPPALARLAAEVRALNPGGDVTLYPGSPLLAVRAMRRGDRYTGCELRADDHAALTAALRRRSPPGVIAEARLDDGYAQARGQAARARRLLVIDPPFERGDDYTRIVDALTTRGDGPALVWLPLKDLDTFDRFLTDLEARAPGEALVVEARLRSLDRPLRMNGCALILLGLGGLETTAREAAEWIVSNLGDSGGEARVWRLD